MRKSEISGIVVLTLAAVGSMVQASSTAAETARKTVAVVAGARKLSVTEKIQVSGRCGDHDVAPAPAPAPDPCGCGGPAPAPAPAAGKAKPGYGFGAKTPHYGPPGQGFTPDNTWRMARDSGRGTPGGHSLPPRAYQVP